MPPIRFDPTKSTLNRILNDKDFEIDIKDVIGLRVASDFYDRDSEAIKIDDYYLTKLEEQSFDI